MRPIVPSVQAASLVVSALDVLCLLLPYVHLDTAAEATLVQAATTLLTPSARASPQHASSAAQPSTVDVDVGCFAVSASVRWHRCHSCASASVVLMVQSPLTLV